MLQSKISVPFFSLQYLCNKKSWKQCSRLSHFHSKTQWFHEKNAIKKFVETTYTFLIFFFNNSIIVIVYRLFTSKYGIPSKFPRRIDFIKHFNIIIIIIKGVLINTILTDPETNTAFVIDTIYLRHCIRCTNTYYKYRRNT